MNAPHGELYKLSRYELEEIEAALGEATRGEFASDSEVADLFACYLGRARYTAKPTYSTTCPSSLGKLGMRKSSKVKKFLTLSPSKGEGVSTATTIGRSRQLPTRFMIASSCPP